MKLTIETVENGFIVTVHENKKLEIPSEMFVIERRDAGSDSIIELLKLVNEFVGIPYDKFSENNINIQFNKKGHKV